MNAVTAKLREVLLAVLPVTAIVLVLHFTLTPLDTPVLAGFIAGALLIVVGLTIFLLGVDIGITPMGNALGGTMVRYNKIWVLVLAALALGFIISIAEPDLHILAGQVGMVTSEAISKWSLVVVVSVGIAALLAGGLLRIVYNVPLYKVLIGIYAFIFALALFSSPEFLAISFDASGATTGALTVPFILSLAIGVSEIKRDSKASEKDSFGLVGVVSAGAIVAVLVMGIVADTGQLSGNLAVSETSTSSFLSQFFIVMHDVAEEILLATLPILGVFLAFQIATHSFSRRAFHRVLMGLVFTVVGLVLFLTGVNGGFMAAGSIIGYTIASQGNSAYVVIVGFTLGFVTVLAEPAVHVLTHDIESVTSGYIKRNMVLMSLAIGVGIAVCLSMVRILVPEIALWHYLLPGYVVALAMSPFVPKLFVGIGFDAGGVASGPMTATFILAFGHGVAEATTGASVLVDGFGMIAMVALTPIIMLQILGLIFRAKSGKRFLKENGK